MGSSPKPSPTGERDTKAWPEPAWPELGEGFRSDRLAGTLIQAVDALQREGARRILACAVHGVLSGPAISRIQESVLEEVIITNTIPLTPERQLSKMRVLSVAPLLAEAIRRIHDEESVSTLFV